MAGLDLSDYILVLPADDNYNTVNLQKMFDMMKDNKIDVLCPDRFIEKDSIENGPFLKFLIVRIVNFSLYYIADIKTKDGTNGFRFFSRKVIDELDTYAQSHGAKGLAWFKVKDDRFEGGISKFFDNDLQKEIINNLNLENDSISFMVGDKKSNTLNVLGRIRNKIADKLELKDNSTFKPVWIVDFPLFSWNEDSKRFDSVNHPFTAPKDKDIDKVLNLEQRHFGALAGQGLVNIKLKNYEKAIESYEKAQEIYPAMQSPKIMIKQIQELIKQELI